MTQSLEDYLEAILMLHNKQTVVRSIDLVHHMGFSKPSISHAVKELKTAGYVIVKENGNLELTQTGMDIASSVYEKHCVLTDLFVKIGVNKEQAEIDACKIEHIISEETFSKMKEIIKKEFH